jgi:hypothetical protein
MEKSFIYKTAKKGDAPNYYYNLSILSRIKKGYC